MFAVVTHSIMRDFGISLTKSSMALSIAMAGGVAGALLSGQVGDRMGRKKALMIGNFLVLLFGGLSVVVGNFTWMLVMRFWIGFGIGLAKPPMVAILSETTPVSYRLGVRAVTEVAYSLGFLFVALVCSFNDSSLNHLSWRGLSCVATIPALIGFLTLPRMLESPVFFDVTGRHAEGQEVLEQMRLSNKRPDVSIEYIPTSESPQAKKAGGSQLIKTFFSQKYRWVTFALSYHSFVYAMVLTAGRNYAQAQVLPLLEGNKTSHSVAPGWEIVLGCPVDCLSVLLVPVVARWISIERFMFLASFLGGVAAICFVAGGAAVEPRSFGMECIFQLGYALFQLSPAVNAVVASQYAVQLFPSHVASSAGSIVIVFMRGGLVLGPILFDFFRASPLGWHSFYYIVAVMSFVAAAINVAAAFRSDSFSVPLDWWQGEPNRSSMASAERALPISNLKGDKKKGDAEQGWQSAGNVAYGSTKDAFLEGSISNDESEGFCNSDRFDRSHTPDGRPVRFPLSARFEN